MTRLTIYACVIQMILYSASLSWCQDYIKEIDAARTEMTALGSRLPATIRQSSGENIRPLERIFEINNYALIGIESYLKMLKIHSISGGYGSSEVLKILNNWLLFIIEYCSTDIRYLEEASKDIKDPTVLDMINSEKVSMARLREAARKGCDENLRIFGL